MNIDRAYRKITIQHGCNGDTAVVSFPAELLKGTEITDGDTVEIENYCNVGISLKKASDRCAFCGATGNLVYLDRTPCCQRCGDGLVRLLNAVKELDNE